jgi:hypothetical protein
MCLRGVFWRWMVMNRAQVAALVTAGLAGDRGGGQPPGAPSPDGCRSLPRTARPRLH